MDRTQVIDAITRFVAARSGEPPARIHEEFDFVKSGLMDSLALIELLFFVQDTFATDIPFGNIPLDQLRTASGLYDLVVAKTCPTEQEPHGPETRRCRS